MQHSNDVNEFKAIIIFPYLDISKKSSIQNFTIKNSSCVTEESKEDQSILRALISVFRDFDNNAFLQWSYIIQDEVDSNSYSKLIKFCKEISTVLRYIRISEDVETQRSVKDSFGQFNFFSFALQRDFTKEGYYTVAGFLNGIKKNNFHFTNGKVSERSRYRSTYRIQTKEIPNVEQHLLSKPMYKILFTKDRIDVEERNQIISSLEWFNRSFINREEVDESEAILNMYSAFEALLKNKADRDVGVKAQVLNSLSSILGHSDWLSRWVGSFWSLRNALVHGDYTIPSFNYAPEKNKKEYIYHLNVARKIFVRVIKILIDIRVSHHTRDIHNLLQSNEIRVEKAKKILLKKEKMTPEEFNEAIGFVSNIQTNEVSSMDNRGVVDFGTVFLPAIVEKLTLAAHIKKQIDDILETNELTEMPEKYLNLFEDYYKEFYEDKLHQKLDLDQKILASALQNFLQYAENVLQRFWNGN